MPAIMFFLIAGILGCIFAMIVVAVQDRDSKPIPPLETCALLNKKEITLYNDLHTVCQKFNLQVTARASLSVAVQPQEEKRRYAFRKKALKETVPFLLFQIPSGKPALAVLTADYKSDWGLQVLDAAKIPYLKGNNYNLPGLEKAIRDKLGTVLPASTTQEDKGVGVAAVSDRRE